MARIYLLLVLVSLVAASCSHQYYIVRHAEKETSNGTAAATLNDPALSEAGKVRALVLRDELRSKHIRRIFATNTNRAIATATPISVATGHAVELYSTRDSLNEFIAKLKEIRKGNVLIVGHSNTIDDIVNLLCNATRIPADLGDSQYDNLFIVTYKGKKIKFKQQKYGYPSNPE